MRAFAPIAGKFFTKKAFPQPAPTARRISKGGRSELDTVDSKAAALLVLSEDASLASLNLKHLRLLASVVRR
jgi:hypothetical protein